MPGHNILLVLAFDGTAYSGWQIQKSRPTIQGIISEELHRITGNPVRLKGSGRTDAGTHARGLVANFLTDSAIAPARFIAALNSRLPRDIRVLSARYAPLSFDARKDARSKIYRYQIYTGSVQPPHLRREFFHFPFPIRIPEMEKAAGRFVGTHDFASFAKSPPGPNTVRQIVSCKLAKRGRRLFLTVEGSGFLHHMVRNMAGTLLEIGRGSISGTEFEELFTVRDRNLAGFTAPAHGLILLKVKY